MRMRRRAAGLTRRSAPGTGHHHPTRAALAAQRPHHCDARSKHVSRVDAMTELPYRPIILKHARDLPPSRAESVAAGGAAAIFTLLRLRPDPRSIPPGAAPCAKHLSPCHGALAAQSRCRTEALSSDSERASGGRPTARLERHCPSPPHAVSAPIRPPRRTAPARQPRRAAPARPPRRAALSPASELAREIDHALRLFADRVGRAAEDRGAVWLVVAQRGERRVLLDAQLNLGRGEEMNFVGAVGEAQPARAGERGE
mmetsp:Transcript_8541/g.22018  ORF Transcript_8541/g.22018 Transcript_8541/m.22018 type:complete len:257 (-) Transcript_8541:152-922(-)